jgi:SAM-dependent methyltransferase
MYSTSDVALAMTRAKSPGWSARPGGSSV